MTYILTANCDYCGKWIASQHITITKALFNTAYVECSIRVTDLSIYPADEALCVHIECLSEFIAWNVKGLA